MVFILYFLFYLFTEQFIMESLPRLDFRTPAKYADTKIIVEDTKLYTSSYLLEILSSKLSSLLENNKKSEGHSDGRFMLDLPDISAAAVEALLLWTQ